MNKYFKNEKSNSRSAAPRKTYDINPALFTDNRPENVVQNKLKETISSRKSVPFIDIREHVSISQASTGVAQLTKTEKVDDFINSDGTQNTLGTLDMAANIGGVVDSAAGLINYGGHVDDLEGITNFKGWKDNFALDGRAEGTDFETANNSWGNDYTGTLGATAGVLGAGATMWNGVRNIGQSAGNIKKAYSAGDTKGGLEQGASIAENLVAIGGSGLGAAY
jgi:hypothetical protein